MFTTMPSPVRRLVRAALIAAVYVVLCLVLQPFSYGPIQVRAAEALTLLPVLCAEAVPGVTVGCLLANLLSPSAHPLDIVVGTLATLLAALATRRLRGIRWKGIPLLASLPPVLFNAVLVGGTLAWLYLPAGSPAAGWLWMMATVGAGQLVSCCVIGLVLVWAIEHNRPLRQLLGGEEERKSAT